MMFLVPTGYRTNVNSDLISSATDILFLNLILKFLSPTIKLARYFITSHFCYKKVRKRNLTFLLGTVTHLNL